MLPFITGSHAYGEPVSRKEAIKYHKTLRKHFKVGSDMPEPKLEIPF